MTSLFDAAVNGTWLTEIDDRVTVTDIREDAPATRITTLKRPVHAGSFFVQESRESLSVTVSCVIWERNIADRNYIWNQIKAWAGNGIVQLQINQRPDQVLFARVSDAPALDSGLRWTSEISITFTAFEMPYWQENDFVQVKTTGQSSMFLPGFGEARVRVEAKNTGSQPITSVTLHAGETWMWFTGLSIAAGKSLVIEYDDQGLMKATVDGVSVLSKRTTDSDDDLFAACGDDTPVSIAADGSIEAVFKARGVYV